MGRDHKSRDALLKAMLNIFQKRLLYISTAILWASGAVWLYFRYAVNASSPFGPGTHPAQTLSLKIHGAIAMVFLVIVGNLLYHIPPGWKQKDQRPSGIILSSSVVVLVTTGWALYYCSGESLRMAASFIHSILGGILPVLITAHVWNIIQRRKKGKRP
jgi:hypothetical protein